MARIIDGQNVMNLTDPSILKDEIVRLNRALEEVRGECRKMGNLSDTKYNRSYVQGAQEAATAIDNVAYAGLNPR